MVRFILTRQRSVSRHAKRHPTRHATWLDLLCHCVQSDVKVFYGFGKQVLRAVRPFFLFLPSLIRIRLDWLSKLRAIWRRMITGSLARVQHNRRSILHTTPPLKETLTHLLQLLQHAKTQADAAQTHWATVRPDIQTPIFAIIAHAEILKIKASQADDEELIRWLRESNEHFSSWCHQIIQMIQHAELASIRGAVHKETPML